ncbi:hypothetical protein K0M31_013555 [Melipona bicolor]|uniref:Uncharacterized protein n=1 Tax=Melipona bicolor TaxID=60889 RepID=A0AA40FI89_9HYME|nr:hypothetical protein K0M31_013555 [Melipona bicolor]
MDSFNEIREAVVYIENIEKRPTELSSLYCRIASDSTTQREPSCSPFFSEALEKPAPSSLFPEPPSDDGWRIMDERWRSEAPRGRWMGSIPIGERSNRR